MRKLRLKRGVGPREVRERWHLVGEKCLDQTYWPEAIYDADNLLDSTLKKSKFKGGSMGERLVSAREKFTDNDGVWLAHKLRDKLDHEGQVELTKPLVKKAIGSYRQALKDLGALK